jgi:hypothetical protein
VRGENVSLGALNCSRQHTENHTISLVFGNATISAPWSDFFEPWNDDNRCLFNIQPRDNHYLSSEYAGQIGFKFIQHMYLAVDYDNFFVGVAPLNHNPGPDHILEIGSGPKLPDAVGDFPATITPNTPSLTVVTSTSTAQAAMRTIPAEKSMTHLMAGLAGAVLLAAL